MHRLAHAYRGRPTDHCVCDQALCRLPNGDRAILVYVGAKLPD